MNNLQNLKPFKRLCVSIGNLPTAYIESMSYYECITYLVKYLTNEVIPTVNNNSEVVKELQEYVAHYFDNLDVQEEINNKLDEMAESGELADIIAQYIDLAGVLAYETVSNMKLAENLSGGSTCKTLGYNSISDGGGSYYKVRELLNTDVVDEATLIALYDNTLVAELIVFDNTLNAEQFGCVGDGITDDTTNLQKAIDYCGTNGIYLNAKKEYLISSSLLVNNKLKLNMNTLINDGDDEAIKLLVNASDINISKIDNNSIKTALFVESSYNNINVEKIESEGSGMLVTTTTTKLAQNNRINLGIVESEGNGIELISYDWGILDSKIKFNVINTNSSYNGIYCYTEHNPLSTHTAYVGEISFYGGRVVNSNYAIYCKSMGSGGADQCEITGLKFYNVSLEGCTNGVYFDNIQYSVVDYPRYQEYDSTDGIILTLNNKTVNCVFNGTTPIAIQQIDYSGLTNVLTQYNMINTKIRTAKNGFVHGRYGKVYSKVFFFDPIYSYMAVTNSSSSFDLRGEEILPQVLRLTNSGTIDLILAVQYDVLGYTDFYIAKTQGSSTINIYDEDGTTLLKTLTTSSPTMYHFGFNQENAIETLG